MEGYNETFWFQFIMMFLASLLPILFRALNHAGDRFSLIIFFTDNIYRFAVGLAIIIIVQVVVYFQPEFVEGLRTFGLAIPVAVSSVVGFGISYFLVKTIPKLGV